MIQYVPNVPSMTAFEFVFLAKGNSKSTFHLMLSRLHLGASTDNSPVLARVGLADPLPTPGQVKDRLATSLWSII